MIDYDADDEDDDEDDDDDENAVEIGDDGFLKSYPPHILFGVMKSNIIRMSITFC